MLHRILSRLKRNQGYIMPMLHVVLILLGLWAAIALPGLARWRKAVEEGGASAGAWAVIYACVFGPPFLFVLLQIVGSALQFSACRKERHARHDGVPDTLRNKAEIDAVLRRVEDALARQDGEALFESVGILGRCRVYFRNRDLWIEGIPWWDRPTLFWNKVYGCDWEATWWDWATMWWRNDTTYLDTYERWQGLKPEAVRSLFTLLPLARFLELPTGYSLDALDIRRALEPISADIAAEQKTAISKGFPLPGEGDPPDR